MHQQRAGASTITQQVARMLFLQSDYMRGGVYARTGVAGWERKVKEAIISVQLEKRYTKREILTLFCNATYFGHGAYGVEAASRLYFGKAGQGPRSSRRRRSSPASSRATSGRARTSIPEAATRRRNYALQRMADEGFITQAAGQHAAKAAPIKTAGLPTQQYSPAPYFVEEVRQQLEARFGAKQLYENGLSVQTTPGPAAAAGGDPRAAGGPAPARPAARASASRPTCSTAGADLDAYRHPRWQGPMAIGDVVPAVVTGTTATEIQARAGRLDVRIPKAGFAVDRQGRRPARWWRAAISCRC